MSCALEVDIYFTLCMNVLWCLIKLMEEDIGTIFCFKWVFVLEEILPV
jgi:hypothetical protein